MDNSKPIQLKIPIRPLSINKAFKGRHFKTPEYQKFEVDCSLLLPFNKATPPEGELFVKYTFFLKNYAQSDADNGIKALQDILKKRGYLHDDRFIKASLVIKEPVKDIAGEKIIIDIMAFKDMSVIDVR